MATNNACNYQTTQYNTLTGGANNQINNVSPGSSGQVLTSNGASAQPTYQAAPAGAFSTILFVRPAFDASLADSSTYYLVTTLGITLATINTVASKFVITKNCTLSACYGITRVNGTLATNENSTFSILLNGTTATTVSSTVKFNAVDGSFSNSGLSISLAAGDYIQFRLVTPAFATNPTTVGITVSAYIS